MTHYLAYGLTVDSDIEPPGALPLDASYSAPTDVDIRIGPAEIDPAAIQRGPYRYRDGRLLYVAPRVARYLCIEGARIEVDRAPGADEDMVQALLIATALPAVLWMRDFLVLHAAAAVLPGGGSAIAIAGPSGAGKSTILDQLLARGARALADDSIAIARESGAPVASGLPAACFLRAGSPDERIRVAVPVDRQARSAPLGAIFILERSAGFVGAAFERLAPVAAVEQVLLNRHRPIIPLLLGRLQPMLEDCAFLARSVPIYVWRRRDGSVQLSEHEMAMLARGAEGRE